MKYLSEDQIIAINVVVQKQQERTPQLKDANALNDIVQSAQQEVFGIALYQDLASLATFYYLKLIK
ncbi:MAG: type II toxin-antitoxin system death-on-curing family toxin, partial [Lacticaseibacillus paracasei]|nr:type II toxin-antitoxin system death-on-curing family toxin [Lacticaseibacillus paracasei]